MSQATRQSAPANSDVTVMLRYARSWPRHLDPEALDEVWRVPISQALIHQFPFDAHFAAYCGPTTILRRLSVEALDAGVAVEMTHAVFDFDDREVHGTPQPARDSWRDDWNSRVHALAARHPDPFSYGTRGGGRLIYTLPSPIRIASREDGRKWKQRYAIYCAYLARRFGLIADPACADWQRLYRLPDVVRDGVRQQWSTRGNPDQIGVLEPCVEPCDLDAARAILGSAFRKPRSAPKRTGVSLKTGVLFLSLSARGDVLCEHNADAVIIRCPNWREHTNDSTGTNSTLLYLPKPGHELGWIVCKHGHCVGKTLPDWLKFFSTAELQAARQAAGTWTWRR